MSITRPCSWPVRWPTACAAPDDELLREMCEDLATELLWNLTRKVYGVCRVLARPVAPACAQNRGLGLITYSGGFSNHVLVSGGYAMQSRCAEHASCDCEAPRSIRLPGPVVSVYSVTVDGFTLEPETAWAVFGNKLYRRDGAGWPSCQDFSKPLSENGTWAVEYDRGVEVPVGGQVAAGLLACEISKSLTDDPSCALPQRVQTVTRQGVTMAMLDTFEDVTKGRLGIFLVDAWVNSVNNPVRPSRVYSPDLA